MENYSSAVVKNDTVKIEQAVAKWFAATHKRIFGNGPQTVSVSILDNCYVIVAKKVLNKFEKSLSVIAEGAYRISYTRQLLFSEFRDECKVHFQHELKMPVRDIRYSLNVEQDKSLLIILV